MFINMIANLWWYIAYATVLPAKSDSDVMFCYQGLRIDRSLVY